MSNARIRLPRKSITAKMFLAPFFRLAAVTFARQRTFRVLVGIHLALMGTTIGGMFLGGTLKNPIVLGNVLLVAGIVEGALLLGWRLTQLPKSQALVFLLVSPLRPGLVFLAEALVGLSRLALVTLAGLPLLVLLYGEGGLFAEDLVVLLALPFIWGSVAGLGLTAWAYEPPWLRRWGERLVIVGVIVYLLVGVLAGENLPAWLAVFPPAVSRWCLDGVRAFHEDNPFGVMKLAMEQSPAWSWSRVVWTSEIGLLIAGGLLLRGAWRLQSHFQEEHYCPVMLKDKRPRAGVGDTPLAWWAVKRVTKYSGRINLWLAGGFALLYSTYTIWQENWPSWLGRQVFVVFDSMGGIPALATALVLLAAVPAAFQYGVWDNSRQDRCRRLELLLLTDIDGLAYWYASTLAAWKRGRGYFLTALLLWGAGLLAGQLSWTQLFANVAAGVILWGLYFTLGFWAFSKGMQATSLGLGLTLGLPLVTFLLVKNGWHLEAALLPPGSVYLPLTAASTWTWSIGPILCGTVALLLARWSLARCEGQLRRWYELNQGLQPNQ
jgi:hypothetical protein